MRETHVMTFRNLVLLSLGTLLCSIAAPAFAQEKYRAMVINGQGNIGIGATDALSRLTVQGGATFEAAGKVSVSAGGWSVSGPSSGVDATSFLVQAGVGDRIRIGEDTRTIVSISNNGSLLVDAPFSRSQAGVRMTVLGSVFRLDDSSRGARLIVSDRGYLGVNTAAPQVPVHVADPERVASGTPHVTEGSDVITGQGTRFQEEINPGDTIQTCAKYMWNLTDCSSCTPETRRVVAVDSQTSLRVDSAFPAAPVAVPRCGTQSIRIINSTALRVDGDASLRRLRIEDPQFSPGSSNWQWLSWDRTTKRVFANSSSRRYKENIRPLEDDFSALLDLDPVAFTWKETGQPGFGFIAEDLDALGLRTLVVYDEQGRPESVNYPMVSVHLLGLVKAQQEQIEKLESESRAIRDLICADHPEAAICRR